MRDSVLNRYCHGGLIRLAVDVIYTKLFIATEARIIRRPAYIRGRKFIQFGKRLTTGVAVRLDAFPSEPEHGACIVFGDNVQLNDYVHISAICKVKIGSNVLIASKVFISDHNHGGYGSDDYHDSPDVPPALRPLRAKPITIEDNVFIGEFVSVLPGVTIGKGSVIGTMSVVTKDIPPYSIAIGAPARVVKRYNFRTKKWGKI